MIVEFDTSNLEGDLRFFETALNLTVHAKKDIERVASALGDKDQVIEILDEAIVAVRRGGDTVRAVLDHIKFGHLEPPADDE